MVKVYQGINAIKTERRGNLNPTVFSTRLERTCSLKSEVNSPISILEKRFNLTKFLIFPYKMVKGNLQFKMCYLLHYETGLFLFLQVSSFLKGFKLA